MDTDDFFAGNFNLQIAPSILVKNSAAKMSADQTTANQDDTEMTEEEHEKLQEMEKVFFNHTVCPIYNVNHILG